jgi:predicted nucleic acid-binding protein
MSVTELTQAVKQHAIDLRKRFVLKLPDAIVAATALALEATLVTNDQRLLSLADVPTQALRVNRYPDHMRDFSYCVGA